jgi:hypothetical protein
VNPENLFVAMAKVRLTVNGVTDLDLLSIGRKHQRSMEGNPNFPGPVPDEATFAAATDTWEGQIRAVLDARTAYRAAISAKAAGRKAYEALLRQRSNHVAAASGGQPGKILSAGLDLRRDAGPIGRLPAPESFTAKPTDYRGRIRLRWKRVPGAVAYQAEYQRRDDEVKGGDQWQSLAPSTAAKTVADGLESGVEYVFRVAAIGSAGPSPWSDLAFMRAP